MRCDDRSSLNAMFLFVRYSYGMVVACQTELCPTCSYFKLRGTLVVNTPSRHVCPQSTHQNAAGTGLPQATIGSLS